MASEHDKDLTRRAAIEKLAKLSAYTAPTVVALLSASSSHALGSCAGMTTNFMTADRNNSTMMGMVVDADRNVSDSGGGANDTATDCGVF